ncbi:MAG: hypothetical protein OEW53_06275 [Actinomycetota bacterium]|nr:hypothetical protein [Gemmatimonadota bacterium]MDH4348328.1 hypothetical protein [Gemmatimonadota bacterium]MDH5278629.1 hypothetical protein [Actinomycetota bacterium]
MPTRRLAAPAAVLLLAACGHSDAFIPAPQGSDTPFDGLQPVRLTFSPDSDLTPSWSPDGSRLLYTFAVPNDPDRDRCVGVLPGGGGSRLDEKCPLTDINSDSTTVSRWPAEGPDNQMAWTEYQTFVGRVTPDRGAIRIGSFDPTDPGEPVRTLPYLAPSGLVHDVPTHLAWLSADELVYVANAATFARPCINCPFQEYLQGLEVVRLILHPAPATVVVVPGTTGATSLSAAPDGSGFYFTLAGDSQIHFHNVVSGLSAPVHDFGSLGVPEEASVYAGTLVARIGDSLATVVLATGSASVFSDTSWVLGAVRLAPDGSHVAAELAPASQPNLIDLYLLEVP